MSLLIRRGDKDFVAALNNLYNTNPDFKYSTKSHGENILINPYLTILGGTTPDWIMNNIQEDVLEGGLSARTFLIHADKPKHINPFPTLSPEGEKSYKRMLSRIETILQLGGQFRWEEEARKFYGEWYMDYYSHPMSNPKMRGYYTRKKVHLLKVAMLHSLAEKNELILTITDIGRALAILAQAEPAIEESFLGVGRNELSRYAQKILSLIKHNKKLSMEELAANTIGDVNTRELGEILTALNAMGHIDITIEHPSGRRLVVYRENIIHPLPEQAPQLPSVPQ